MRTLANCKNCALASLHFVVISATSNDASADVHPTIAANNQLWIGPEGAVTNSLNPKHALSNTESVTSKSINYFWSADGVDKQSKSATGQGHLATVHRGRRLSSSDSSSAQSDEGHHAHQYETLVFLFMGLSIGIGVLLITTHPRLHNLQFTVVMFVIGIVFGIVIESGIMDNTGMFVRSWNTWITMDPHLLLFVFLPPLLFGDASAIDTHVAKHCGWRCLFLAGPGVVVGAGLTASVLYLALPWGWDFSTSLFVGSILAATDPVAVVGLLKELGASPSLTISIQGESLLNDGTAVVLFTVFYEMASGKDFTIAGIITFLVSATLGAVLIGAIVGLVSLWLILQASSKLNHHNAIIQIGVTVCCSYWSFILAEGVFHFSGVLSTVTTSLILAHRMWPLLISREAMGEIWHVIELFGNALVFFLAGAMTTNAASSFKLADYFWLLFVYVAIVFIRFAVLFIFWPLLKRMGDHPITIKDILVMTWGGLRGMVGLAFAILVRTDLADGKLKIIDGDRVLFLVGGITALTLLVNATTCPALVKKLKITQTPSGRKALINAVASRARDHIERTRTQLTRSKTNAVAHGVLNQLVNRLYTSVEHHTAGSEGHKTDQHRESVGSSRHSTVESQNINIGPLAFFEEEHVDLDVDGLFNEFQERKQDMLNSGALHMTKFQFGEQLPTIQNVLKENQPETDQLTIVREVFLEAVGIDYLQQLKDGKFRVGDPALTNLLNSTKLAKDKASSGLYDWDFVFSAIPAIDAAPDDTPNSPTLGRAESMHLSLNEIMNQTRWGRARRWFSSKFSRSSQQLTHVVPITSGSSDVTGSSKSGSLSRMGSTHSVNANIGNVSTLTLLERWLRSKFNTKFERQTQTCAMINAFIEAHEHAQSKIVSFFGDNEDIDSPEEACVIIESQCKVFAAAALRASMGKAAQVQVNTMLNFNRLAEGYRNFILETVEEGVLKSGEASVVLHAFAECMKSIGKERRKILKKCSASLSAAFTLSENEAAIIIQKFYLRKRVMRQLDRATNKMSVREIQGLVKPMGNEKLLRQISGGSKDKIPMTTTVIEADLKIDNIDNLSDIDLEKQD